MGAFEDGPYGGRMPQKNGPEQEQVFTEKIENEASKNNRRRAIEPC